MTDDERHGRLIKASQKIADALGEPTAGWRGFADEATVELKFRIPVKHIRAFRTALGLDV